MMSVWMVVDAVENARGGLKLCCRAIFSELFSG